MILTFSKPEFEQKILSGIKIHTLRVDPKNRWKNGMKIHFWLHNPRNKNKNPRQFHFVDLGIMHYQNVIIYKKDSIYIDNRKLSMHEIRQLAINDGFENETEFWEWFNEPPFILKLIHWTEFKY